MQRVTKIKDNKGRFGGNMNTAKKKRIAADLIRLPPYSRDEILQRNKISKDTYYKLLNDTEFCEIVNGFTQVTCEEAIRDVIACSKDAAETILNIMKDQEAPASVRLKASSLILEFSYKHYENVNIIDRLNELEDIVRANEE